MDAAIMAPDYAWRQGFYECKKRRLNFTHEADHLLATGEKAYTAPPAGCPPAGPGRSTRRP